MKKENIIKLLSCAALFILWILPCFELEIFSKTYVYLAAFLLSVAVIYIFKKEGISFLLIAVITAAASIYEYEYIFVVLPVVLLIFAHRYVSCKDEKKNESFNTSNNLTTLSFMCICGQLCYAFIQYMNTEPHRIENIFTALRLVPLFLVLFAVLALQSRKRDNYKIIPKKKADKYFMIYLTSFVGLVVSVFTFYALNGYGIQSMRTEYIFWFIYVLTIGVNEDPYIGLLFNRIKQNVENVEKIK